MDAVLEQREEQAYQEADVLRRAWGAPLESDEAFLAAAVDTCRFVDLLCLVWGLMLLRLWRGGAPASLLENDSTKLLELGRGVAPHLDRIAQDQQARELPPDVADSLKAVVQEAKMRLAVVVQRVERIRGHAARPPRVSADPEQVKRLAQEADQNKEWLPLRTVAAQMREAGKKE